MVKDPPVSLESASMPICFSATAMFSSMIEARFEGCEQAEVPARRSTTVAYLNKVFIN